VARRPPQPGRLGRRAADQRRRRHPPRPGVRLPIITDELAGHGITASRNRVNRLCTQQRIFSKRGRSRTSGPPVHDDLVERALAATTPNRLWLTDITEHPTVDGKLSLCAVKDACTNRVVGYSMADRMTSQLAVDALASAVALRRPTETVVHADRGSQFRSRAFVRALRAAGLQGSMGRVGPAPITPPWSPSSACSKTPC
jgi:putative transposase